MARDDAQNVKDDMRTTSAHSKPFMAQGMSKCFEEIVFSFTYPEASYAIIWLIFLVSLLSVFFRFGNI